MSATQSEVQYLGDCFDDLCAEIRELILGFVFQDLRVRPALRPTEIGFTGDALFCTSKRMYSEGRAVFLRTALFSLSWPKMKMADRFYLEESIHELAPRLRDVHNIQGPVSLVARLLTHAEDGEIPSMRPYKRITLSPLRCKVESELSPPELIDNYNYGLEGEHKSLHLMLHSRQVQSIDFSLRWADHKGIKDDVAFTTLNLHFLAMDPHMTVKSLETTFYSWTGGVRQVDYPAWVASSRTVCLAAIERWLPEMCGKAVEWQKEAKEDLMRLESPLKTKPVVME